MKNEKLFNINQSLISSFHLIYLIINFKIIMKIKKKKNFIIYKNIFNNILSVKFNYRYQKR